jgi:hypothetical protein
MKQRGIAYLRVFSVPVEVIFDANLVKDTYPDGRVLYECDTVKSLYIHWYGQPILSQLNKEEMQEYLEERIACAITHPRVQNVRIQWDNEPEPYEWPSLS